MKIHKAYKFRLYPNKEQAILINKTIGCSRFVYNHFLNQWNETYK
ncbi:helix-turn-helix domain-containing protein, partial [Atopostipes suicloacalis]